VPQHGFVGDLLTAVTWRVHAAAPEPAGDRFALQLVARFLSCNALEVGDGDDVELARTQGAGGAATGISVSDTGKAST
jgi:hypothetical protein